jgi:PST family polysaccharide transporter
LLGVYESISGLAQSLAGMGVNNSGVRQIAAAVGTGDQQRIARTVAVLRRTSLLLGVLGAALLVVFSAQMSTLTFGSAQNAGFVALLSLAVLFRLVAAGQGALLQGMRRISDLARIGVLSALLGTMISIPLVYFLREKGVVPALVSVGAMMLLTSWWYSRKVRIPLPALRTTQIRQEATSLLKLGCAFMVSAFLMSGAGYAVRAMVLRMVGTDAAGFYQAAWTLGGLYVGVILQAMGADFYPRLTGVANDNTQCNRLVNEQAQVSLLLAGPGVLATLTFTPAVIAIFYSGEFHAAVGILRWFCIGMTLRVITWPMGFMLVAKGKAALMIGTELGWVIVNVGLSWVCLTAFGLDGAGMAFLGAYVFHGIILYPIVRQLSGFRWSASNGRTAFVFLSLIAVVFCGSFALSPLAAIWLGIVAVLLGTAYSIRTLFRLIPLAQFPGPLRRLLERSTFVRTHS